MKLCCDECCAIVLTEKDTDVRFCEGDIVKFTANNLMLVSIENDSIDFSTLDSSLILYISRDLIKDYLHFLKKDLTHYTPVSRGFPPYMIEPCRTPYVFREAACHSVMREADEIEFERKRSLTFAALSIFLNNRSFIPFLMRMVRNNISANVYNIIQSDIHKTWSLTTVASCLCLSPSSLKKKLKNEQTSYSKIVTDCRMRYAVEQLLVFNKNISQVSTLCGYSSTSYFISVFKEYYGVTPLNYVHRYRDGTMLS
ncbi:AraC family transcriptional regulator [Edwardsiella piscicida]|uniref:AraC-type DNA-binding domain-containing protein n=3 Tax=Edwardsiella TaxID=635 RepID=A0A0H3DUK4_EDWTF|nr:AraC family transcriptional regulator [Edwardsiella piscicida]ACY86233.1 AraC-type DNA-binding domain-containing protein [Edwardsiella tarda EIB202]ADM43187.1 AraC-type DNA-binding domain-containing protein [Edwardsiella tarda FL6-60]AOP44562.1 AraC family transcriptional regulator [Edwardsiella piscicida]ARD18413.1 AraC family transcriptional regulator [Edwardsiella piscicida]EKS7767803.1 AraC family transcriptional regulator [Edwardsiella piscicida]